MPFLEFPWATTGPAWISSSAKAAVMLRIMMEPHRKYSE